MQASIPTVFFGINCVFRLLLSRGRVKSYVHRILIFILYRIVNHVQDSKKTRQTVQCSKNMECGENVVFATYYLNQNFLASSHLLWLCSPFRIGPGRKPRRRFSHDAAHLILYNGYIAK